MMVTPIFLGKMGQLTGMGEWPGMDPPGTRRKPYARCFSVVPWHDRRVVVLYETQFRSLEEKLDEQRRKLDATDRLVDRLYSQIRPNVQE
jgi:hypothetical protein